MAKIEEKVRKASNTKGNSEDSLLGIYIFRILKKYSSPDKPLSTQDVMDYLEKDYSIGNADKSDAQKKKSGDILILYMSAMETIVLEK